MQNNTTQPDEIAVDLEKLASNIEALALVGQAIRDSRLQQRTIITLIHEASGVGKRDIQYVLDHLPALATRYLKPVKKG